MTYFDNFINNFREGAAYQSPLGRARMDENMRERRELNLVQEQQRMQQEAAMQRTLVENELKQRAAQEMAIRESQLQQMQMQQNLPAARDLMGVPEVGPLPQGQGAMVDLFARNPDAMIDIYKQKITPEKPASLFERIEQIPREQRSPEQQAYMDRQTTEPRAYPTAIEEADAERSRQVASVMGKEAATSAVSLIRSGSELGQRLSGLQRARDLILDPRTPEGSVMTGLVVSAKNLGQTVGVPKEMLDKLGKTQNVEVLNQIINAEIIPQLSKMGAKPTDRDMKVLQDTFAQTGNSKLSQLYAVNTTEGFLKKQQDKSAQFRDALRKNPELKMDLIAQEDWLSQFEIDNPLEQYIEPSGLTKEDAITVDSQEIYAKLPIGAYYVDSQGTLRRKGGI